MAKMKIEGFDHYIAQIEKLGKSSLGISKMALYDGAAVVADKIRTKLNAVTNRGYSEGDLSESLGIAGMREEDGGVNTIIGFSGYDRDGIPNPLKARVLESGSSKQKKTPFIRPAIKASKAEAEAAIAATFEREIEKIMKG